MNDTESAPVDPNGMAGMNQGHDGMSQGHVGSVRGQAVGPVEGMARASTGGMQPSGLAQILQALKAALAQRAASMGQQTGQQPPAAPGAAPGMPPPGQAQ